MDADKLWGWGRLYRDDGSFRWGRTILNGFLHFLMALGCGLLAGVGVYFCGWGFGASAGIGSALGTLAVTTREVIQYLDSRSPHLVDRAGDIAPSPLGGLVGGLLAWWVVSSWLL